MAVHLKGHFCISSHAARRWRKQSRSGETVVARIINTTSGAGLQGSIGQSNYAAAKAGIAALTLNQAAELGRYGVTANALAPAARTAMTTAVEAMAERMARPEDGSFDYWAPENVSPLVAWLASPLSSSVTGRVFEAEGGRIAIAAGWRGTEGAGQGARWQAAEGGAAVELGDRSGLRGGGGPHCDRRRLAQHRGRGQGRSLAARGDRRGHGQTAGQRSAGPEGLRHLRSGGQRLKRCPGRRSRPAAGEFRHAIRLHRRTADDPRHGGAVSGRGLLQRGRAPRHGDGAGLRDRAVAAHLHRDVLAGHPHP